MLETAIFVRDTNNCHKYTIRLLTNTVQFHSNLQWYTIIQNLGNFRASLYMVSWHVQEGDRLFAVVHMGFHSTFQPVLHGTVGQDGHTG